METREDYDPTWKPYCLKCDTMVRMKDLGVENGIQKFECTCCDAKHQRKYPKPFEDK